MASKRFEDDLRERLQNPEFAAAYMEAAADDDSAAGSIDGFLHAIREIALAREGGISGTAQDANIGRQTLYDAFKRGGNPQIRTVDSILRTVAMRLNVTPVRAEHG